MARPSVRSIGLVTLSLAGCGGDPLAVLLLPELPPNISHFAVLRFDEAGTLTGSTGLLDLEQLPLKLEDERSSSASIAGFTMDQLADLGLPERDERERAPVRLATEAEPRLPVPALYLSGPLMEGTWAAAPSSPEELSVDWLSRPCPMPVSGRTERVNDRDQFLVFAKLDARSALLVTVGSNETRLYRADLERTERIEPPGFSEGGPGRLSTTAVHVEAEGAIWLASTSTDGLTRIHRGTLEAGFELVSTSTRGERIGWLAPDETEPGSIWLLSTDGVFYRLHPEHPDWRRHVGFPGVAAGPGRIAQEPDGSLLALHRGFPNRELARITPEGEIVPIPRADRQRPIYLLDLEPAATFLAYDGISSTIFEVQAENLVAWPGTEDGVGTVEPLTMARIGGGFAISGIQGFLSLFVGGTFCPVASGILGPHTVENIVEVEGGLLSGPGPLRNADGVADLTRVSLR